MFAQLAIGSALIVTTMLVGTSVWLIFEIALLRLQGWLMRPPHMIKVVAALLVALFGTLLMITTSVWIWALAFQALGIFDTLEAALYFALVSFTTLGFGDVLLPLEWRLLGGMTAANGFLGFGFVTALLVETMRNIRLIQSNSIT